MKTEWNIQARAFPITVHDHSTGQEREDQIVLTKEQLQAAQIVGQSSKELIQRIYNRQGFRVLDIGKPERRSIDLSLDELWRLHEKAVGF